MSFLTIDFETYYDDEYSLSRMTTEEYVRDPRFQIIGVCVKEDEQPPVWYSGTHQQIRNWLLKYDWKNSCILAHNTLFDGAILFWILDILPAYFYDTLCMARAVHGVDAGGSLKSLSERYGLGQKGNQSVSYKGKRREEFTPAELADYGSYCENDTELCFRLFERLMQLTPQSEANAIHSFKYLYSCGRSTTFPQSELDLIDMTLRMFITPKLMLDREKLDERLKDMVTERSQLVQTLIAALDVATEEDVRAMLASNKKFADLLVNLNIPVPTKISPRTGKETFAFAKTDEGFIELQNHRNPLVQHLCSVRLGVRSTIEESRIQRFIDIHGRNSGILPIPLKYYGAHTGRWSGLDLINLQNLPSRDAKKKSLKQSIVAPPGYVLLNSDSSQIEARIVAWLAGQHSVVQAFREKRDVYCEDATKVYGRTITKDDKIERFVGKTMRLGLGFGTGGEKLRHTLATTPPYANLDIETCRSFVNTWRAANGSIVSLWGTLSGLMYNLMAWPDIDTYEVQIGVVDGVVYMTPEGIRLPNNLFIRYPNIRTKRTPQNVAEVVYDSRSGTKRLWGGSVTENIVQALARIVVAEQMLQLQKFYPIVLTVHDSAVLLVPEKEASEAVDIATTIMSTAPKWAVGLPVACEVKVGKSYGDC